MSDSDVQKTMEFLTKGFPNPISKNQHTQLGVHFEEIAEMLDSLQGIDQKTEFLINLTKQANQAMSLYLKQSDNVIKIKNREDFLDSLCDQLVTATGVAHVNKMDIVGAFGEVNRSNLSKFDENGNPILDGNLKIVKGPHYFKPNLKPFV